MKKYNLVLNGEVLETENTREKAKNYIEDSKISDPEVAAKINIESAEMDIIEGINYIKKVVGDIVNKICRTNFNHRELRRLVHYDKDLEISEINGDSFYFEMGEDFYDDKLENNEYALYGNYVKKESSEGIRMWFKGNPLQTDYEIRYEIIINFNENKVIIKADDKEEFVADATFPEIEFNL